MSPVVDAAELLDLAREARAGSYAPYSNFHVGAVVLTEDGSRVAGANVENAAYGSSLCAEAVAIGTAVAGGARKLVAVAVSCPVPDCFPCGQCRQRMSEFDVEYVITEGPDGEPVVHRFDDLLPHRFDLDR